MHSFAHHRHNKASGATAKETRGLVLNEGWRYDLTAWFHNIFSFRGQWCELRRKAIALARLQPGDMVLDVGCGTGTLALEAAHHIGSTGRVVGIDPGTEQIARASKKAARLSQKLNPPIEFQPGIIEQIPFPDQTFDVVLSSLMMHHLPASLKRQGVAEIARVLKPSGRLVIADFTLRQERQRRAARFRAGGSSVQDLVTLVKEAGFSQVETEEMPPARFSALPGAGFVRAYKS